MIQAFNFTCWRDNELSELMQNTLLKYCPVPICVHSINTDTHLEYLGYGSGCGWPQGLLKVKYLRTLTYSDDDFVLSIDSDVVFTSPEVFQYVIPAYGIIGTEHQQPFPTEFGLWGHCSGAMIFLRGDIARKIANLSDQELEHIRFNHFKKHNITENEDVMLSYFAKYVGAESFDLGSVPGLSGGNFEGDCRFSNLKNDPLGFVTWGQTLKSFYHLNYCPTSFLGEPVSGKWDIAKVLKQKGMEL